MADKHIVVAAHGHCFDGLVSAALFSQLRSGLDHKRHRFSYRSCGYGPNMQTVPEKWLSGDENAIVDFRFADSAKLTWYFDHHVTAFASDAQRERCLADERASRYFFDPTYGSCSKLIADIGKRKYGVDFEAHAELIAWADRIDTASFASAADAIDRSHPVMQLAAVVEQHGDGALFNELVPRLTAEPLVDVAKSEPVQARWQPIAEAQRDTEERIDKGMRLEGRVLFVDLSDRPLRASGKFVAYALSPSCMYSVAVIRMRQHYKISVGYNPWCGQERLHDIASICQRHGGGGHPVVGAFSVPLSKLDEALRLAREVVAELNA